MQIAKYIALFSEVLPGFCEIHSWLERQMV